MTFPETVVEIRDNVIRHTERGTLAVFTVIHASGRRAEIKRKLPKALTDIVAQYAWADRVLRDGRQSIINR